MYDRARAFLFRAGTLILASMILIWALLYFPGGSGYDYQIEQLKAKAAEATGKDRGALDQDVSRLRGEWKRQSLLGRLGKTVEPAVEPLGWDWRIGTAALASFPAREVVVGTLGILYDVGEDDEEQTGLKEQLQAARWDESTAKAGNLVFTLPVALSLMVFFALCCQCVSTLVIMRRETNSWRWPVFTFTYMTALAYLGALLVYQIGSRLG
jgi:ferrous iron transport protein B